MDIVVEIVGTCKLPKEKKKTKETKKKRKDAKRKTCSFLFLGIFLFISFHFVVFLFVSFLFEMIFFISFRKCPICRISNISDCGISPSISNAEKSTSASTYPTTVYYGCKPGYYSSGLPNYITCHSAGYWTSTTYHCIFQGTNYNGVKQDTTVQSLQWQI